MFYASFEYQLRYGIIFYGQCSDICQNRAIQNNQVKKLFHAFLLKTELYAVSDYLNLPPVIMYEICSYFLFLSSSIHNFEVKIFIIINKLRAESYEINTLYVFLLRLNISYVFLSAAQSM